MSKLSRAELARALNLSRSRITAMAKDGCPLFSVEAARIWRQANVDPRRGKGMAKPAAPAAAVPGGNGHDVSDSAGLLAARRRREEAEAGRAELLLAEEQGRLCAVAQVHASGALVGSVLARQAGDMPFRISAELVGKTQKEIHRILSAWVHAFREQTVAELRGLSGADVLHE